MTKSGIDHEAIITAFAQATARQGETLRKTVSDATLKALQGRELTRDNIRKVLKNVTQAASAGAAQNPAGLPGAAALLDQAFAGMDAALLQAVEAQRTALQHVIAQGMDLNDKQLKGALAGLGQMESVFFTAVSKAVEGGHALQGPWQQVLEGSKGKGTGTGAGAGAAVLQLVAQARDALGESRASGAKAAQTMMDSYAALASGVLIGMSEALQPATADAGRARRR